MCEVLSRVRRVRPGGVRVVRGARARQLARVLQRTRDVHERAVRERLEAMFDALSVEFEGDVKIFRQHRDLRFSRDKRPCKDRTYGTPGGCSPRSPRAGCTRGRAITGVARDQLERYRAAVADDSTGPELEAALAGSGLEVSGRASRRRRAATRRTTRGSSCCATSGWSSGRCCPPATVPAEAGSRMSAARGARRSPSSRGSTSTWGRRPSNSAAATGPGRAAPRRRAAPRGCRAPRRRRARCGACGRRR